MSPPTNQDARKAYAARTMDAGYLPMADPHDPCSPSAACDNWTTDTAITQKHNAVAESIKRKNVG